MKAFTDIEQSKKLASILTLDSADQIWERIAIAGANLDVPEEIEYWHNGNTPYIFSSKIGIPCWSLAALLEVLPERVIMPYYAPYLQKEDGKYHTAYGNDELLCKADNPIDACYEMILKLHEQKLL